MGAILKISSLFTAVAMARAAKNFKLGVVIVSFLFCNYSPLDATSIFARPSVDRDYEGV